MIDFDTAKAIAERTLSKIGGPSRELGWSREPSEKPYGWLFYPVPKRYLETHHPGDLLPGLGPFLVERRDGAVVELGSVPLDRALAAYERKHR